MSKPKAGVRCRVCGGEAYVYQRSYAPPALWCGYCATWTPLPLTAMPSPDWRVILRGAQGGRD